jgi:hypothetical protein
LTTLNFDIGGNEMGEEGSAILCEGVSKLLNLTNLNLNFNFINVDAEGSAKIGEGFFKLAEFDYFESEFLE